MRGRVEGMKDRPCVIVLSVRKQADLTIVTIAPITHSEPVYREFALEIPIPVKRRLNPDDKRSWIILNDFNQFIWPRHDLRPIGQANSFVYGGLPANLYRRLRDQVLTLLRAGEVDITHRQP